MPVQRSRWSGRFRRPESPRALLAFSAKRIQPSSSACPGRLVCGEVASDPLLLIQADYPGIFPHHAFVENPARENIEVLLFQGYQVTVADLSDPGNGVQRDPAELPLLPQCIAEFPHTLHPSAGPIPTFSTIRPLCCQVKSKSCSPLVCARYSIF